MRELSFYRQKIDEIDEEILRLLNERAKNVIAVGEIKKKNNAPIWVPSREQAIFDRLKKLNTGPFPSASIRPIFREIISASLSLEEVQKVGYLGPEGTFTNLAGIKHFGLSAKLVPVRTIPEVFEGVDKGRFVCGVIPVENSLEGVVNHTLDMFMNTNIVIMGEIYVEIVQNLMSATGNISDIKAVYSHPNAIGQCRGWLAKHLPDVPVYEVESTAKASEMAKSNESIASIGSEMSEIVYNLKVVERGIEDGSGNFTRFLIIGKTPTLPTGNDKTSLMFAVSHTSGALCRAIEIFSKGNINMTKLESRPSKIKAWEYLFYTDIDGHKDSDDVKAVLKDFENTVPLMKILGSYPKGEK
ncbi:MAG: prephenate dehydratase [Deferribacterales bacterium]|nr:prephenate dehydratase [Deferribacterales bacterium]